MDMSSTKNGSQGSHQYAQEPVKKKELTHNEAIRWKDKDLQQVRTKK